MNVPLNYCACPSWSSSIDYSNLNSSDNSYCYDTGKGAIIVYNGSAYSTWFSLKSSSFVHSSWSLIQSCTNSNSSSSTSSSSILVTAKDTLYLAPSQKFDQYEYYLGLILGIFLLYSISRMVY